DCRTVVTSVPLRQTCAHVSLQSMHLRAQKLAGDVMNVIISMSNMGASRFTRRIIGSVAN
ncbi:MAG: hypothetical protein WD030_09230, partial [Pirellulales bacterium]